MAPPLLQLKDIGLTFGGTPLLTGAELSVSPGERVSLVRYESSHGRCCRVLRTFRMISSSPSVS